jgi:hypothetical protein
MLEHPSIWQYSSVLQRTFRVRDMGSDNLTSADNQQVGWFATYLNDHNESPVARRVMEWSELHGDMQIEAEMTSRRQLRP